MRRTFLPALLLPALLLPGLLLAACTAPDADPLDAVGPAGDPVDTDPSDTDADDTDTHDTGPTDTDTGETGTPGAPPIVLVVLADDLGENVFWAMEEVQARLVPQSVRFTRTYATVPLCCPVRASFLQGGWYAGQTGVHGNDGPNGGITPFYDADTLATRLQAHGYATGLIGKYLNGYEDGVAPYVPPGWDLFLTPTQLGDFTDDVEIVRGSSAPDAPGEGTYEDTGGQHFTGWVFDEALAFLDAHPDEPVFLLVAPQSPHVYGTPAAEDLGSWTGYAPRPPSFAEEDVADKPAWIRRTEVDETDAARWDAETIEMMENLESLDRGVGVLLDGLAARGLDDRTTLVFTSDNGHLHGEHRLVAKGVAYEESVRVPLLVRAPGLAPREDARLVAMNLDVPATVAELAGLPPEGEGTGLVAALADPSLPLRDHIFLETSFGAHPVWAGVVTERWKYVEWGTGETELYDLVADPYELESLHAAPPEDVDVATLAAWVDEHRALNVTRGQVDTGTVGAPYTDAFETWGGVPPLTWTLDAGTLPGGLSLSADGVVSGTPTEAGSFAVQVRVTDAGASPVTGAPATWVQSFTFTVGEAGEAARATAARTGGEVSFVVPARPGARVELRLHLDDTWDTPPRRLPPVVAGADGRARLTVPVDDTRVWHWSYRVDGVLLRGGRVPEAAGR